MLHSTFEINQFVIFKHQDEWQEGRIVDIVVRDGSEKDNRTYYKVLSLSTLLEIPTLLYDHILHNNSDNIKKIKLAYDKIPVSKEIRALIEVDKEMIQNNKIYKGGVNMGDVFSDFSDFLCSTKVYLTKEEILLSVEGLRHLFDQLIGLILITSKEDKYLDNLKRRMSKKKEPVSFFPHFGLVYGIRMAYYVMKDFLEKVKDPEVKFLLYEFLLYFLDFCSIKMEKYYDLKYYE